MRPGQVSLTAVAVAAARGLALSPDATATELLPGPLGSALSQWQALPAWARSIRLAPRIVSAGLVDHLDLRTRAIDRELEEAVLSGARTLVILGAGFDGRAYRLPCLRDLDVFEVDHPDTSASKQARSGRLTSTARSVRHVAVDFDEMSVHEALEAHGHDASEPTVWIWEGVTPYLPAEATEITLRAIARRSAASSRLLMTYAVPKLVGRSAPRLEALVRQGFAWLGEPLRGAMSPQDASRRVQAHGFAPIRDSGQREWAGSRRFAFHLARPLRAERLLVSART